MKKIHFIHLSDSAMTSLKKIAPIKKYSADAPLYYQGQTPIVAYFIIKGNILLQKNNKTYHKLTRGCVVGCRELLLNTPSTFTANVVSNSEICYIDKSTLLEIKNSKNTEMLQLCSELTEVLAQSSKLK
jgi:CRP-like cAMP-binding protein